MLGRETVRECVWNEDQITTVVVVVVVTVCGCFRCDPFEAWPWLILGPRSRYAIGSILTSVPQVMCLCVCVGMCSRALVCLCLVVTDLNPRSRSDFFCLAVNCGKDITPCLKAGVTVVGDSASVGLPYELPSHRTLLRWPLSTLQSSVLVPWLTSERRTYKLTKPI